MPINPKACVIVGNGEYAPGLENKVVYLVVKTPGKSKRWGKSTFSKLSYIDGHNGNIARSIYEVVTSMVRTLKGHKMINEKVKIIAE